MSSRIKLIVAALIGAGISSSYHIWERQHDKRLTLRNAADKSAIASQDGVTASPGAEHLTLPKASDAEVLQVQTTSNQGAMLQSRSDDDIAVKPLMKENLRRQPSKSTLIANRKKALCQFVKGKNKGKKCVLKDEVNTQHFVDPHGALKQQYVFEALKANNYRSLIKQFDATEKSLETLEVELAFDDSLHEVGKEFGFESQDVSCDNTFCAAEIRFGQDVYSEDFTKRLYKSAPKGAVLMAMPGKTEQGKFLRVFFSHNKSVNGINRGY